MTAVTAEEQRLGRDQTDDPDLFYFNQSCRCRTAAGLRIKYCQKINPFIFSGLIIAKELSGCSCAHLFGIRFFLLTLPHLIS